ncbi:BTAD domain-containing putative transcriptional regulator [Agromyces sp. LHK192]|uniref:nSTAND1 domain-containing NTPase n=1 Tax=Agromyces sp. LHK192 TaxID=2498704 RepID=UPI0013E30E2F|nr:BTAD domain-containing putative transcriptional regulator [Agromyces sp. LHK192]
MDLGVLGELEIGDAELSPRERAVLAALTVAFPAPLEASALAEAVWSDAPPATWRQQVKTAVARIRASVGPEIVSTGTGGYALHIDRDAVDALRFETLVAQARSRASLHEPDRAVDVYQRALALWRGTAYPELARWEPAVAAADRLDELRRSAEEELLDARLACGEHRSVVADAERLVREAPLREHRWATLALANYRCGRQAEALAAIRAARERLDDELGIEPGRELVELERAILRQDPSLEPIAAPQRGDDTCPYRGLSAFTTDDSEIFFGRDREVAVLLDRLSATSTLVITGPSGSGKSSVMLAGVVPELRRRGRRVEVIRPDAAGTAVLAMLDEAPANRHGPVVVVDQLEEWFAAETGAAPAFRERLADAVSAGTQIVATVRSDYLDTLASTPELAPLLADGVSVIGPMTRDDLRLAIEEPARRAGLRLEPGLVELILRDAVGQPAALPHLSHALVETWLRREGRTLTVAGYEESGGIVGAIAQSADRLYDRLDAHDRELCRTTFLRLVGRGPDGQAVRRRTRLPAEGEDERSALIARLDRARLITAEGDSIAVAHESIAEAWPRLSGWLEEDAEGTRLLVALTAAADDWDEGGRRPDDLVRGTRLQALLDWRDRSQPNLTALEAAFVEASDAAARAEVADLERRVVRQRRTGRRLRGALIGTVAALAVASLAAVLAVSSADTARRSTEDAQVEALASRSIALQRTDRDVAALIAAEMHRRWPDDPRTRAALMSAMTSAGGFMGSTPVAGLTAGAVIPGTREALLVRDGGTTGVVHDLDTGEELRTVFSGLPRMNLEAPTMLALSDDGSLASVSRLFEGRESGEPALHTEVRVFDLDSGRQVGEVVHMPRDITVPRFSPSEERLVMSSWPDGGLHVIELPTMRLRTAANPVFPGFRPDVDSDPGRPVFWGDEVILAGSRDRLTWYDASTLLPTRSIEVPDGSANEGIFPIGDGSAVTSGEGGLARVLVDQGTVVWYRPWTQEDPWQCRTATVLLDRGTVLCGSRGGVVTEFGLADGEPTGAAFEPQAGPVNRIDVATDPMTLVAFAVQGESLSRWRLDGSGPASRMIADGHLVVNGFDPGGSALMLERIGDVAGGGIAPSILWDPEADEALETGMDSAVSLASWAGPGVVAARRDGILTFFDVSTGRSYGDPLMPPGADFAFPSRDPDRTYVVMLDPSTDDGELYGEAATYSSVALADVRTGRLTGVDLPAINPLAVADTTDGDRVVIDQDDVAGAGATLVYDGRTGDLVAEGLPDARGVLVTADGTVVSSGTEELLLSGVDDLEPFGALPSSRDSWWSIQMDAPGRTLLSPTRSDLVSIFDLETRRLIGDPLQADSPFAPPAYLRHDGMRMALNLGDGVAYWTLDPADHFRAACRLAGRELTDTEWSTYLGSIGDRRETCAGVLG